MPRFGLGINRASRRKRGQAFDFAARRAALVGRAATLAMWDAYDPSGIWQDSAATTAAGAGDPIGRLDDWSGNAQHLTAASDSLRPARTDGVTWGFAEQRLDFPGSLASGLTLVALISTAIDTVGVVWGENDASPFGALYQSGNAGDAAGTLGGTVWVAGAQVATRGDFYTAIADGEAYRVEHRATTVAIAGTAAINSYSAGGLKHIGVLVPVALLDTGEADYATALSEAQSFADTLKSELGL